VVRLTLKNAVGGGTTAFLFCDATAQFAHLRLGVDILPLVTKLGGVSVEINPTGLGQRRGLRSITMREWDDYPEGLGAGALAATGGTFWERLFLAFPAWHRAKVEYLYAFEDSTFTSLADADPAFVGLLEDHDEVGDHEVVLQVADAFVLKASQVPHPLSEANTLAAGITATDRLIPLALPSELPDPTADLPSPDWFPPTVELEPGTADQERVAYGSKSGANLVACSNYLTNTENLSAGWALIIGTGSLTGAATPGPWGPTTGSLVACTAAGVTWIQSSGLAAAGQAVTLSAWVREHPSYPGATVALAVSDGVGGGLVAATIALTPYWQRFEVQATFGGAAPGNVVAYFGIIAGGPLSYYQTQLQLDLGLGRRPWVPGTGTAGGYAGRGYHGSTARAHSLGDKVREVYAVRQASAAADSAAEGLHPVWIAADLLNRAYCPPEVLGDVRRHLAYFQPEADFQPGARFRRILTDSQAVSAVLGRVCEQYLFAVWVGKDGVFRARLSWRPKAFQATYPTLTRENDILETGPARGSFRVSSNKGERANVVYVHWSLKASAGGQDERGDRAGDFTKHEAWLDADPAVVGDDFRSLAYRSVFADFIYRTEEARGLGGRFLSRFRYGPRKALAMVTYRRYPDLELGDVVWLDHPRIRARSGTAAVRRAAEFQIISCEYGPRAADLKLGFLEATRRRYAHITPYPFNDYPAQTVAQQEFYGSIGTIPDNLVGSPPVDGYYIL
jgi:hypothetical protein